MARINKAASGMAQAAIICDRIIMPTDVRIVNVIKKAFASGGMSIGDVDRIFMTETEYVMGSKAKPKSAEYKEGLEFTKECIATCGYNAVGVFGADTFDKIMGFKGIAKYYGQVLWSDIINCKVIPLPHPGQLAYGDPLIEGQFQAGIKLLKAEQEFKEHVVEKAEVQYTIIDTLAKFNRFLDYYLSEKVPLFAYDTETTSLSPEHAELLTIQFSHEEKKSYLIPAPYYGGWTPAEWAEVVDGLKTLFADDSKLIIGHNIKYDNRIIHRPLNIPPRKFNVFDTMIAKFLCDETTPNGLKDLACQYTDMGDYEQGLDIFKKQYCKEHKLKVADFHYGLFPFEILAPYALADTDCTMRLYNIFKERLIEEKQEQVMAMVMRFVYLLTRMEINGSPVDVEYAQQYLEEVDAQLVVAKQELDNYSFILVATDLINQRNLTKLRDSGKPTKNYKQVPFNFNSTDQKRTLFYDVLNLPLIYVSGTKNKISEMTLLKRDNLIRKMAKETHGITLPSAQFEYNHGKREYKNPLPKATVDKYLRLKATTDKRSLEAWHKEELQEDIKPFMDKLRRYSELTKIRNTYIFALLARQKDGWIHPSFNPIGAKSGRLSCKDPNYQNIPAHSDEAKKIKRITKAPKGWVLVGADLSAAEMRWVTIASGDAKLIELFNAGVDSHGAIAKEIFGLDCDANEVKKLYPLERQIAKMCQFLSVYGGKADALAAGAGITVLRAQEILDAYFEKYSGVRDYLDLTEEFIKVHGYAQSLLGRRNRHRAAVALAEKAEQGLDKDELMVLEKEIRVGVNATIQSVSSDGMLLSLCNLQDEIDEHNYPIIIINTIHDSVYCLVEESFVAQAKVIINRCLTTLPTNLINPATEEIVHIPIKMESSCEVGPSWDKLNEESPVILMEDDEEESEDED